VSPILIECFGDTFMIDPFSIFSFLSPSQYHPRDAAWPRAVQTVKDIRKAQPSLKKIGAIGFCWGATSCLYLAGKKAGESQVDAIAFAHPSVIEPTDFEQIEKPGLFMTCEVDGQFPKEKQEASKLVCEKKAKEDDVFTRFSYYPRVSHGWSIKGDETEAYSATAMNHAAAEAIGFFSLELS
jgi:dienelactone hydrolase